MAILQVATALRVGYKRGGWPGRKFLAMHTNMADEFKQKTSVC